MADSCSIENIDLIAASVDPIKRNYQITQSYHELSSALSKRIGPCANWCSFATWASRQAGQTIRREDLNEALAEHLNAAPAILGALESLIQAALLKGSKLSRNALTKLIWETVDPNAAMNRASAAVARGNQKVYAEIGREFARFIQSCSTDRQPNAENLADFCASLKPGDPPDGQRYLKQAFSNYYRSFFEANPKAKAELILLANLAIGFHEQTRLQPEIAEALEASVEDPTVLTNRISKALFPTPGWLETFGNFFRTFTGGRSPLEEIVQVFSSLARQHIRLFLTNHMMELGFPNGTRLRLGHDLVAPFPVMLQQLENADLKALLSPIDPSPGNLQGSGALDWADLPDRLHFIADLFRCYQENSDLLAPPFDVAQQRIIFGKSD